MPLSRLSPSLHPNAERGPGRGPRCRWRSGPKIALTPPLPPSVRHKVGEVRMGRKGWVQGATASSRDGLPAEKARRAGGVGKGQTRRRFPHPLLGKPESR